MTAFDVLEQHHWSEAELQKYYAELDVWRGAVDLERGARAEGELAKARSIAIKLLKAGIDIQTIASSTDLSIEQIEELKKN